MYLGSELHGKYLTIIGLGATGIEVAKRANCFGMHVSAATKHPRSKRSANGMNIIMDQVQGVEHLSNLLATADYVSIHTPLTTETENLIGAKELNSMKKSAFLINV